MMVAIGVAAVVCRAAGSTAADSPSAVHFRAWPQGAAPFRQDPRLERRIADLLASMTLEEKVGQVIQADISTITPDDLLHYPLGAILAGGNSGPDGNVLAPAADWLKLADAYHAAVRARRGSRIPLLFGIDDVHGDDKIVGGTIFPHNIGLGAAHDPELVRRIGAATAKELRVTGQDWTFAPMVAVARDPHWGRTYESYSADPALVRTYAAAIVRGLQGDPGTADFLSTNHVLATAKHFLADGGTERGIDEGDARISEQSLRDVHAQGYYGAVAAGVQTVMASYSSWQGFPMHANPVLLTGLLKHHMGFDGFVVGDWNGHAHVPGCRKDDCPAAFNAGVDMFMAPDEWRGLYANTLAEVERGEIPRARLDDAVRRILRVKLRARLFEEPRPSARAGAGRFELLGEAADRTLAREAVRKSLVLLKNARGTLPLSPRLHVLVAGDAADSIPRQCGGWTLTWAGTGTHNSDFPHAQTIFAAIREAAERGGGSAVLSLDGSYASRPDAAVVVFGEPPYAEMMGDRPSALFGPSLTFDDADDLAILQRLHAGGIPTIAVFLSGRPLDTGPELAAAEAFVAAWLPGGEGGGIADLLFRSSGEGVAYDFTGRLPFPWPGAQGEAAPQFPMGYGLSYGPAGSGQAGFR
jgi:beta-glucosidase